MQHWRDADDVKTILTLAPWTNISIFFALQLRTQQIRSFFCRIMCVDFSVFSFVCGGVAIVAKSTRISQKLWLKLASLLSTSNLNTIKLNWIYRVGCVAQCICWRRRREIAEIVAKEIMCAVRVAICRLAKLQVVDMPAADLHVKYDCHLIPTYWPKVFTRVTSPITCHTP